MVSINRTSRCNFYEHSYSSSLFLNDCSEIEKKLVYFLPFPSFLLVVLFVLYCSLKTEIICIVGKHLFRYNGHCF
jgi:hypothetical protein